MSARFSSIKRFVQWLLTASLLVTLVLIGNSASAAFGQGQQTWGPVQVASGPAQCYQLGTSTSPDLTVAHSYCVKAARGTDPFLDPNLDKETAEMIARGQKESDQIVKDLDAQRSQFLKQNPKLNH